MLQRFQMYKALISYVEAFETCYKICSDADNYTQLFKLLTAYQTSLAGSLKTIETIKFELHNTQAKQIYLNSYRTAVRVLDQMETQNPTVNTVVNDTRLLIGVFSNAAMKLQKLTTIQLKYFDSVMGMARETDDRDRLHLIDVELERVND